MNLRKLYEEHRPLLEAMFWAVLGILVILFWPQEPFSVNAAEEVATPLIQIVSVEAEVEEVSQPELELEPEAEPVQEVIPEPEQEPVKSPRYGFTADDIYLMSVLLTGSKDVNGDGEFDFDFGRQDEYDQISLVLCVVMNRVRSDLYPNTVSEVIWQKNQFAPMRKWQKGLPKVSDISIQRVTEWCEAYDRYDPGVQCIPEDHLYFHGDGINNHSR